MTTAVTRYLRCPTAALPQTCGRHANQLPGGRDMTCRPWRAGPVATSGPSRTAAAPTNAASAPTKVAAALTEVAATPTDPPDTTT
jgi:hypothetical protein